MFLCNFYTVGGDSDSSSLCNERIVVLVIACGITFIVTLISTAIITFPVTYICVKKKLASTSKEPVVANITFDPSSHADLKVQPNPAYGAVVGHNKTGLELQPNPAYGTSHEVIMKTNPVYESCK